MPHEVAQEVSRQPRGVEVNPRKPRHTVNSKTPKFPVGIRHGKQVANEISDQNAVMGAMDKLSTKYGGNRKDDGTLEVFWPLPIKKQCNPTLYAMILRVQNAFYLAGLLGFRPDGVIDPEEKTIKLMRRFENSNPPAPKKLPLDIIVRFKGEDKVPGNAQRDPEREEGLRKRFSTPEYLKTHQEMKAICFKGFREQEKFVPAAVAEVLEARKGNGEGVTIVVGNSAGGVSALKTVVNLVEKGIQFDYVAINDAAFFETNDELIFKPEFAINLKKITGGKSLGSGLKENFFQTVGHEILKDPSTSSGFAPGTEFHGPFKGFGFRDILVLNSSSIHRSLIESKNAKIKLAESCHEIAGGVANNIIFGKIAGLIRP